MRTSDVPWYPAIVMIWIGTSGYNYPEWRGTFYPDTLPASKMLAYYAERFPTVEINYTFYRLPTEKLVQGWAAGTPRRIKLTLKAPQRITHDRRLQRLRRSRPRILPGRGSARPETRGAALPARPDVQDRSGVFDAFLADLPTGARAAFEFRHASWLEDDVYDAPAGRKPGALHRRQRHADRRR